MQENRTPFRIAKYSADEKAKKMQNFFIAHS